jgi:hypothetical protein
MAPSIYLDGKLIHNLSLKNRLEKKSSMMYKSANIPAGSHSVYIESAAGLLPVDCIKITFEVSASEDISIVFNY